VSLRLSTGGETISTNALLGANFMGLLSGTLVPLIALVIAYSAVTGERESGSLKLLLSLPHSRADVVFGKVAGRSAALSTAIIVGFVVPAVILALGPLSLDIVSYVGYTLLVALLVSVFVAIAVGWSAAAPSQRIALGGAIGLYFLFRSLLGYHPAPTPNSDFITTGVGSREWHCHQQRAVSAQPRLGVSGTDQRVAAGPTV